MSGEQKTEMTLQQAFDEMARLLARAQAEAMGVLLARIEKLEHRVRHLEERQAKP
jgi:polyhydroxyalkanoate synthesis regulator phasin